jgi:CubicO group peptidase (beta-lactamase class C family)
VIASVTRRRLLAAAGSAPLFAACASDLSSFRGQDLQTLAARLGVCAVSAVDIQAGQARSPWLYSGCVPPHPVGAQTVFQAASLTKPLVAFLALRWVQQGKLDLQAPVSRYLPQGYVHRQNPFGGPADRRSDQVAAATLSRLSVGSLLNHSAGLPNWTKGKLAPEFEPGSRWQYSGEGYVLLQAVLAAVAGQDFESVVRQQVFDPLGMHHSWLRAPENQGLRSVRGRSRSGADRHLDFVEPNAAASLYTTAEDYAKLVAAWWAEPALLSLVLAKPMPVDPALGLAWGYGWGIETADRGPYLWQWGNNPGFRAFVMFSASSGDGFVLLTNSERGMPLAAALAGKLLPAAQGVFRFGMLG